MAEVWWAGAEFTTPRKSAAILVDAAGIVVDHGPELSGIAGRPISEVADELRAAKWDVLRISPLTGAAKIGPDIEAQLAALEQRVGDLELQMMFRPTTDQVNKEWNSFRWTL